MADWLVPVTQYSRYKRRSGRVIDGGLDQLAAAALTGDLASAVYDLRGPLVDVEAGDRMWLYSDERDTGVFGVGRAQKPTRGQKPTVTVAIDRARTRTLTVDPLPSVMIRRWLPELKHGALLLDVRPRALTALDAWEHERAERDVELLGPVGATPWRSLAKRSDSRIARDDVLAPIARLLRSQEFAVGVASPSVKKNLPLLVARRVRDVVVVDVERVRSGRGREEGLAALGCLREYRWQIERRAADLRLRTRLWMAFTARPDEQLVAFLEDEDVLVSWQHQPGVAELSDRSKQRWYQYLGVR